MRHLPTRIPASARQSHVARLGVLLVVALLVSACGSRSTTGAAAPAGQATHAGAVSASAAPATGAPATVTVADWPEFGYDPARSNAGPANSGITAADAGRLKLRQVRIDGIADSSPIELGAVTVRGARHDLAAVTTSYGSTIAFDPASGRTLWEYRPAGGDSSAGNPQVTTASPVADPDRRFLYTASPDGVIHKLAVATGRPAWSRSITTDPAHEKMASALNVSGPYVVAVTGGYFGDAPPYDGHVVMISRRTSRIAHVWNTECSDRHRLIAARSCSVTNTRGDNAIWGRAGAVIEPGSAKILIATGNGPFDGHTSWGDSALELTSDAGRLLHNWTPPNQSALSHSDTDVGSTSPAILPTYGGRHLAVQGGKDGKLHLLDLARLNGSPGGAGPRLGGELGEVSAPGGAAVFTALAVWSQGGRGYLFVATDSGTAAYQLVGGSHPRLVTVWQNATAATSPVIAGGLLYAYDEIDGKLIIRRPQSGTLIRALSVPQGHWSSPIVVGGRIILPTGSYHDSGSSSTIDVFHVPGR